MRYWAIAPNRNQRTLPGPRTWHPESFDLTWDFCVRNGVIAIGWHQVGDLTGQTRAEIKEVYEETFKGERTQGYLNLQRFWLDVNPGDRIVARYGTKVTVGIGTVMGKPYYDKQKGDDWTCGLPINPHPSFLSIKWDSLEEITLPPHVQLPRDTVHTIEERYKCWDAVSAILSRVYPSV